MEEHHYTQEEFQKAIRVWFALQGDATFRLNYPLTSDSVILDVGGYHGDWTQAMYGTVEGVVIDYSSDATLVIGDQPVSLFQHNMFAVRAEIEVGFRADTNCFNLLTAAAAASE